MSKYDVTHWSDYVRGLADPPLRRELDAHLALPGSESARRSVAAFESLLAFARRDALAEPPAAALHGAKVLGSLLRPPAAAGDGLLARLRSFLVFDSAAAPLAYGLRDLADPGVRDRQLIYRSDDYFIDLRLEAEPGGDAWVVVGQLLHEKDGVTPLPGVPLLAASADRFVARARTGELGEFQAEGLPGQDLRLLFLVSDEICLEVPVSHAIKER